MKICSQCGLRLMGTATRCPVDGGELVPMPDPMIGKVIGGRYRVEAKLGAGGMATVYRASNDVLGRQVAIKFLAPDLALDSTQRQRFLREARATNRIRHEHIVDITDYGEEGKLVYLVMELLEGEPLNHLIARGPVPPPEALHLLTQVTRALARAHELEVIHRDLKPENIFLTMVDGRPHTKLLDFGLAHVSNEARLTAVGAVFGTPEYLSPEQARGAPNVGPAADLYALGVVLFELLTQRLPFEGSTAELIVKHLQAQPPTPSQFRSTLSPEIDALILKLLSKDPAQRHRDAYHLLDDLHALLALYSQPAIVPTPSKPMTLPAEAFAAALAALDQQQATAASAPFEGSGSHPTAVFTTANQWVERRAIFREAEQLLSRSHNVSAAMRAMLQEFDRNVDRLILVDGDLARYGRQLAEHEADASAARERIGRALDELSRDESALRRQAEDILRRMERAAQRAELSAAEFASAWKIAVQTVDESGLSNLESAVVVETAARRATAWRQSMLEQEELVSLQKSRGAAADDLKFQLSQLKGRMGALNAEVEHETAVLREQVSELGVQAAMLYEKLNELATTLGVALGEYPEARKLLQSLGR
ncbi:MAG: protein kinase [Deltaproteobacteria bacterium]|nr:protein kinase [Deltaproteobacteria bacterium]